MANKVKKITPDAKGQKFLAKNAQTVNNSSEYVKTLIHGNNIASTVVENFNQAQKAAGVSDKDIEIYNSEGVKPKPSNKKKSNTTGRGKTYYEKGQKIAERKVKVQEDKEARLAKAQELGLNLAEARNKVVVPSKILGIGASVIGAWKR